MAKITYTNKVALNENPEIADINKVTDDDMNEIKQVVNDNYDHYIEIQTTTPTDNDCKLFINPNESVNVYGNYISNSYGTSQEIGYSQEYVNGIVEKGSNENGTYIKFKNGIMICTKNVTSSVAMTTLWEGSWYEGNQSLGDFAQEFLNVPEVSTTNLSSSGALVECFATAPTSTSAGVITYCRSGSTTRTIKTSVIAIGTWK